MSVPIPKTLETPPRTTGNATSDLPILIDWFWRAYQVITQSVAYINAQITAGPVVLTDLPDPATTTLAQAQTTANEAFTLASQAKTEADTNTTNIATNTADIAADLALIAANTASIAAQQTLWNDLISGTVAVADPNTSFTVTFAVAQPDTNYRVEVQPKSITGVPVVGAFVVKSKAYTTADFTVTLFSAPGAAAAVTWEWQLIRTT